MKIERTSPTRKRTKFVEEKETLTGDGAIVEVAEDDTEANPPVSEQMEVYMSQILEKIDNFTQQVSELLESGKSFLRELGAELEERMIAIHKEQMEKWQDEIKELRFMDASNEEINALLHNAQLVLHNVHNDHS
ncbi:uncharacterized protein LOC112527129 isoform X2 [Cynara cardunculus var. scolymus]|uniref:uncharacterized protein LOC112527129 isoform X2 n=1 Tax=Cynara cardunculus var. scolymus TaxID=59895 RepID=UPI000D62CA53|nr:uncharacterized protein LOC112527129 isoform X2 [Cynara cardunculus var. scolymus]